MTSALGGLRKQIIYDKDLTLANRRHEDEQQFE